MNELTLAIKQNPGTIELNFDDLEEQLEKKLADYRGVQFTEESKTVAKAEVASLRKLKKNIEDGRKAVKKKWMEPYDEFDKRMKALSAKVDEPIDAINHQVQEFEDKRRREKRAEILKLYEDLLSEYKGYEDFMPLEKIYDPKWDNASTSIKSIKTTMNEKMSGIKTAVTSIKAMRSEKESDALEMYKVTMDLNRSIQMIINYESVKAEALKHEEERRQREEERRRQAEIDRAVAAEREAIRREEEIRKEQAEMKVCSDPIPAVADDELPFVQPNTVTAFYRVVATPEELEQVEMAFNSIGIYFERRMT